MRVAIISALEPLSSENLSPRAFVRIAGRSIIERQLDFAIEAGCERIACLSNDLPSDLIELQHRAEKSGAKFQAIRDIRPLSGIIRATDEILLIEDGLAFDHQAAGPVLSDGRKIGAFPAEEGIAAGFERLDRDLAWAGIALVGGSLIEKMASMPSDVDVQSCLMRLALQNGAQVVSLPKSRLSSGQWLLVTDETAAERIETQWLKLERDLGGARAPLEALAGEAAFAIVKRHRRPLFATRIVVSMVLAGLVSAGGLVFAGYFTAGIAILAISAFGASVSLTLNGILGKPGGLSQFQKFRSGAYSLLFAVIWGGAVVFSVPYRDRTGALFAALILIGLLQLLERINSGGGLANLAQMLGSFLTDRLAICGLLVAGFLTRTTLPLLQIFSILVLLLLLVTSYRPKLTQA